MKELTADEKLRIAQDSIRSAGRDDFLFGRGHESPERLRTTAFSERVWWAIDPGMAQEAYEAGRQEAEAELRRDGPTLLYLRELLRRMEYDQERSGEWFGYDFDAPIFLLKKALESLEQEDTA